MAFPEDQPDVLEAPPPEAAALKRAALESGFAVLELDGAKMRGKAELLEHMAAALKFPADFGANWDAAVDYLSDLPSFHPSEKFLVVIGNRAEIRRDPALYGELFQTLEFAAQRARRMQGCPALKFILSGE
ncbi:MAG: barstar family protein [Elusimicrobiales bacterium]